MYRQILSFLLCIVMILSFSVVSFAEEDRIPEAGDHVFFGHYEQDNDLNNGPEPIEWRVLEVKGNEMLLLSEYILDAQPFNEEKAGNLWESSSLRTWLNRDFIDNAFSNEGVAAIQLTKVDNSAKQGGYFVGDAAGTDDYIFLLSYTEVRNYFSSPILARGVATDYSKPKLVRIRINNSSLNGFKSGGTFTEETTYETAEYVPWWYRTPSTQWDQGLGAYVEGYPGPAWVKNFYNEQFYDYRSSIGIRPAMWVDISQYLDLLPAEEAEVTPAELTVLTCDESITADTVLGDTAWKMWLPEGFVADELTEADITDYYIGYYLRDDDIIAVQYSDNSSTLTEWQKELTDRGFTIEGLYNLNSSEAVLYRDEDADTMTASVLDGRGKLLEVTFYPYSSISKEADSVISSIQQEAPKKRLSGAAGSTGTASGSGEAVAAVPVSVSQEEAYQEMVTAYRSGNFKDSYSYYEQAKGYKDADKYGNLLKARLCYDLKLEDKEIEALEKAIVSDISFADSKDVLVCNSAIAHYYLLGTWYSPRNTYSYIFEVKGTGGVTTTVPVVPRTGNYYDIVNGTYWRYFEGKWEERTAVFDFNPISKNKMELYSYEVQQSYTFNKTK